ncbi:MAG TPA: hypothetical protein VHV78_03975, partial [Gemmatimonadaceae bacterium]|nr:hypothetical protein [Gemmatimonadaceae bacterium]
MGHRSLRVLFAVAAAIIPAGTGCASDATSGPKTQTSQGVDVSPMVSEMTGGGLGLYSGVTAAALGLGVSAPAAVKIVAADCPYSSASQVFICPPVSSNGVTYNVSFWLYDASGNSLSQTNAVGIASIR